MWVKAGEVFERDGTDLLSSIAWYIKNAYYESLFQTKLECGIIFIKQYFDINYFENVFGKYCVPTAKFSFFTKQSLQFWVFHSDLA